MKELIDKISSYNLFNYFFPGVVFTVLLNELTVYNIILDNLLITFFMYYFIGLVISRVGSVAIAPLLKKMKFIRFADYNDFVDASKKDEKIDLLSEVNNMYRTLLALIIVLFIVYGFSKLKELWQFLSIIELHLLATILLVFFLFAYRKQTSFVRKRVFAVLGKEDLKKQSQPSEV